MKQLAEGLWTSEAPLKMLGVDVGARMTVVDTGDGLWVHSPIPLDEDLRAEVEALGAVEYLVAPNRFHHLFAGEWADAYPDATLCAAPGLPEKRDDLDFDHVLTHGAPPWGDAIEQKLIDGASMLNEVVFFHPETGTLISADIFHNKHDVDGLWNRFYCWMNGILNRAGVSGIVRLAFGDKEAVQRSYMRMLEWDIERIIIAHGRIVETNAEQTLRRIIDEAF